MEVVIIIIAVGTLLVAVLTFLALVTDWFKRTIPIEFGFRLDNSVVGELTLSSGDAAKPIFMRFHNSGQTTMIGLVFDIRFLLPLSLSGTDSALSHIPGKTVHGRVSDQSYYLLRYSDLELVGLGNLDFRVELNTTDKTPGTYKVLVTVYSTQRDYKFKKTELFLIMT